MKESCIEYLVKQFNDLQLAEEIFSEYVDSAKKKALEAKESFDDRNWMNIDLAAHAIKGNALSVNDLNMVDLAIKLRSAARLSNETEVAELIENLNTLVNDL